MRINYDRPYHLTYCSNIHPGEDWPQVFHNLQTYIPPLKAKLSPNAAFGIGLRLANTASHTLLCGDALPQFQDWLRTQDCYVFTLNGFPYGGFHHQVVKDKVYAPDWSEPKRLAYTQRLIRILATLLPEGLDGGISTIPLSYKPWWQGTLAAQASIFEQCSLQLAQIAGELARLQNVTGKLLHLDLEPEPDALLENADELIAFFENWLLPIGQTYLQQHQGMKASTAAQCLRQHIRVCYDTCHFAVEYADPEETLLKFHQVGIAIGKIQLSSALQISIPADPSQRHVLRQHLEPFAESTYLHQVIEQQPSGRLHHYSDLRTALPALRTTAATEWRTHFHVPIFMDHFPPFTSTQKHITSILGSLSQVPDCTHLEIETYTWEVLPPMLKGDILGSIQREYEWVLASLPQPTSV